MGEAGKQTRKHRKAGEALIQRDVVRVIMSDMHSGSNYALFLDRAWHGKHTSHVPREKQIKIRMQFEKFADEVKQARKNKAVELIHNGDAIDGDHHHSGDICTLIEEEQEQIHIELMNEFQKRIGWRSGDKLYYTVGTRVHTGESEHTIGKELNAIPDGDFHAWEFLPLVTNGTLSWFVHHGSGKGDGANEGNSLRNWLKGVYFESLKDKTRPPDIVYSAHVHTPTYGSYVYREEMTFKTMHGIITPSWQMKTAYAWQKVPAKKNKIGGVIQEIKADGTICIPRFSIMTSD
jgi:hypothetical protein